MSRSIVPVLLAAVLAVPALSGAAPAKARPPAPAPSPAAAAPAEAGSDVVATIAGEPYTARQLEQAAGARLFQLRTQQYQAERQILEDEIGKRLLEREAAARKITVDALLKQQVEAKAKPVPPEERKASYDPNKARFGPKAEADDMKKTAAELGLDAAAFDECLDSGKHASDWQANSAAGEKYGVQSTPAFFINGRLVVGAQPIESFARVVDEELARTGSAA